MKENQYVIISKTTIQKRIEELEKESEAIYYREGIDEYSFAKEELDQILSKSIPLIPVIEDAFNKGVNWALPEQSIIETKISKEEYISNLKLDI